MRRLRIAGIVVASLAALLAGGLLLAWLLFDPNAYKDELQRAFQGATGRELRLDGPLSLSVFPWLAVETGAASVSNRAGFGAEPFAALDRARLGVRLWPLLSARRVELGPVRVDGLALNLAIARDGSNNWSDLIERFEKAPAPPATEETPSAEASIARLDLRNAALRLDDAQAGTHYVIDRWDLATGMLRKGDPFDVETSLRLARNDAPIGRLKLRTRVHPDQADRLVFEDSEGTLRLARRGRDDVPVALRVPRIAVANATRDIAVENLEARIGDAVLAATLGVEQGQAGPRARGRVQLAETNLRELLRALGIDPPATRDPKALARIAGAADVAYSTRDGLQVDARDLRLDATTLSGRITLADFERRAIRFDLRGDGIDLDRYLPPPAPAGTRPSPTAPAAGAPAKSNDARPLDARGSIALGRVVLAAIPLQDVVATVRFAEGRLALDPLKARVFDGSSVTRLDYELAAPVPTLHIEQRLADVDVGAMLGQLIQVRQLQGRGNGHFVLTTRGAGAEALFANLAGPFDLTVTNGALVGTDLWYEIERAVAAAQLEPSALTGKSSGRTEFSRLAARGTIGDRTLRNEHVEFVSDFARVRGRGRIDYGRDALDLDLTARLLKAPPGRFLGIKVRRLEGADIPLKVTGKMSEPQVRPNVSKLLEAAAKDAIKEPLEGKIKEKLEKLFKF
jgi:AsmA protein